MEVRLLVHFLPYVGECTGIFSNTKTYYTETANGLERIFKSLKPA